MIYLLVRSNYLLIISIIFCFDFHYAEDNKFFPNSIYDIDNNKIVLSDLSKNKTVCVITIKSVTCPICTEQLIRIRNNIIDFNKCNLTFLVLAPGGKNGIEELKRRSRFPFPFIQDSDLKLSEYFNLAMPPFEIVPSIILLNKDGSVRWIQSGRGPDYYSDQALNDYLDCSNWI